MKTTEMCPSSQFIYTPTIYKLSRIIFFRSPFFLFTTPCFSPTPLVLRIWFDSG